MDLRKLKPNLRAFLLCDEYTTSPTGTGEHISLHSIYSSIGCTGFPARIPITFVSMFTNLWRNGEYKVTITVRFPGEQPDAIFPATIKAGGQGRFDYVHVARIDMIIGPAATRTGFFTLASYAQC